MGTIKHMDVAEFRRQGFLQEANRQFFHPLGLALEITQRPDGSEFLSGVWDYRNDPEGVVFTEGTIEEAKVDRVERERKRHEEHRVALLGSAIQLTGWEKEEVDA
jgi:hypothetical protein